MKILIADDELRLRKVVTLHLKKSGFEVVEASNGQQALDVVESVNPDIIVLDIMMPEVDGLTACREIRKIDDFKDTPIILLTAKATADDIRIGEEAGATEYITKPFSPKLLIEKINNLLRR